MLSTKIASFSDTKGCSCSFLLRNYLYRGRMLSRFAAFTGGRCEKKYAQNIWQNEKYIYLCYRITIKDKY